MADSGYFLALKSRLVEIIWGESKFWRGKVTDLSTAHTVHMLHEILLKMTFN